MNKFLLLPLFATMVLVSQAWGEECKYENKKAGCQYPTGCFELTTEYTNVPDDASTCKGSKVDDKPSQTNICNCSQILDACKKDGELYTFNSKASIWDNTPYGKGADIKCINNGGTLAFTNSCHKWCKYTGKTSCDDVKADPTGQYGTATADCTAAIANCSSGGQLYDNADCGGGATSSASGGGGNSSNSSGGGYSSNSGGGGYSSSGGGTPIISYNNAPIAGLNVAYFARSLQIASGKDATVSLFDIRGKQMFSQKVLSGTTTISLANQKQGVYYAVVRSASQKQTMKIILK